MTWRSRVEAAIRAQDNQVPMPHGPDLTTPLSLLAGVLQMQARQASRMFNDAMLRKVA